jgi:hypothetical protein
MALGAAPARAAEQRVLVVSQARAFAHDSIPIAKAFFDGLGERTGRRETMSRPGWAAPCLTYGNGRVFYNALGHRPETWRDNNSRRVTARGLAWALGG